MQRNSILVAKTTRCASDLGLVGPDVVTCISFLSQLALRNYMRILLASKTHARHYRGVCDNEPNGVAHIKLDNALVLHLCIHGSCFRSETGKLELGTVLTSSMFQIFVKFATILQVNEKRSKFIIFQFY